MRRVHVVPTGVGNLASVRAAFARLDCELEVLRSPEELRAAEHLVLPGVGHFRAALEGLQARGLDLALRERLQADRPTLAICLGLQLLAAASAEAPGLVGLAAVPLRATAFAPGLRSPHMGWSRVSVDENCRLLAAAPYYFAHSYALRGRPAGFGLATAEHGGSFVAALERGALLACQFHPELSAAPGQALLSRWLRGGAA